MKKELVTRTCFIELDADRGFTADDRGLEGRKCVFRKWKCRPFSELLNVPTVYSNCLIDAFPVCFGTRVLDCDFIDCMFSGVMWKNLYFYRCRFARCDFTSAELLDLQFADCTFEDCRFNRADLQKTTMNMCDGGHVNNCVFNKARLFDFSILHCRVEACSFLGTEFTGCFFNGVFLRSCNFRKASFYHFAIEDLATIFCDFSGATGLLDPAKYMKDHFVTDDLGYIVYKSFGVDTAYNLRRESDQEKWTPKEDKFIEEIVNPNRGETCGCGVNVGTFEWVKAEYSEPYWQCHILWEDLFSVVVPYNTDGKIRCGRIRCDFRVDEYGCKIEEEE